MKYLVYGYYGYNNLGDELLLNTIIENISIKDKSAQFKILNKYSDTLTQYKNVEYTNIRNILHDSKNKISKFLRFFNTFKKYIDVCDVFIIGGGTLLMDTGKFNFLMMYLSFLVQYANFKNKKVILLGVGIDILGNPFSNIWAKKILKNCNTINLRDKLSYQVARKIDVKNKNILLTQDLVFSNQNLQNIKSISNDKVIGISLIDYSDKFEENSFFEKINNIITYYLKNNYKIKLLSFQTDTDRADNKFYKKFKEIDKCEVVTLTLSNIKEVYNSLEFVLSMRFHGILLGLIFHKKVLGIIHEIKNYQLCFDTSIDYIMLEELSIENILDKEYKRIKKNTLIELEEHSKKNFDFIKSLI